MQVVKTIKEVREIVNGWRSEGLSVGFVPTMGYLHEGHQSLIRKSAEQNDRTVVSVFVNPIQFGPNEDLESYPRDLERDKQKVIEAGGDLIFNPEPAEMYPGHFTSFIDHRTALRRRAPHTLPWRLHRCRQTLQHCVP